MIPPQFPKACACGRVHQGEADWEALPLVGTQVIPEAPGDRERPEAYLLELRDCPCGSTLAVEKPLPPG